MMKSALPLVVALALLPMKDSAMACYDAASGSQRRFVLNDGEVFDTKTGLTWQRCSLGTSWDGRRCTGEIVFASLDQAKQMANAVGPQWRVPSGPELESIVDLSCGHPVVDKRVFPDIHPDEDGAAEYWTTNPVGTANLFYFFDFMTGQADGHSRGFRLAVRLVKSRQ
jgi:hypothetical protein